MELRFLGTSAGIPSKTRNVSALALRHGAARHWYLIDCGEGTQHRLLHTPCSLHGLRAIFITHVHGDHTLGLPGLLSSASMANREESLPIIAPPRVRDFIEAALAATDSRLSFDLEFHDSEAADFHWDDGNLAVSTIALSHRVPCRAFLFTEKNLERRLLTEKLQAEGVPAGPLWGELHRGADQWHAGRLLRSRDYVQLSRSPRRLIVAGDNDDPELLFEACREVQLLVHEATYTQAVADRVGPAPMHSSAARVAAMAARAGLPHLILTHFSTRYRATPGASPHIGELAEEAARVYRGNLQLARDLAGWRLEKDFSLSAVD